MRFNFDTEIFNKFKFDTEFENVLFSYKKPVELLYNNNR
jgi:hypothetical protein